MPDGPFSRKVAVVTGASRGIGRATAIAFARAGAQVVVAARSTQDAPGKLPGTIDEVVREIASFGGQAIAVPADITKDEQVEALYQRTVSEMGQVDILVNNAAINYPSPFAEIPMRRWDLVLSVNLRGTVLCTKVFLPHMLARKQGVIINLSSYMAVHPLPGHLAYGVSKMAIERFTEGLGWELMGTGVAVNCLRIELNIATEGWTFLNRDVDFSTWERPEEAAEAILWLASQPPSFTGRVVTMEEVRRLRATQEA
jgi:citronellol/citronellal dehydrogenase